FISKFVRSLVLKSCSETSCLKSKRTFSPRGDIPMREFIRPAAVALSIACLAASMAAFSATNVMAQAKQDQPPPVKQMALTEKQIQGVLTASKEMDDVTAKMPQNGQPDAKMMA